MITAKLKELLQVVLLQIGLQVLPIILIIKISIFLSLPRRIWGKFYNAGGIYQSANADWFDNQTVDQMNRWQNPGDITNVPQARLGDGNGTKFYRYLEKANFIRLRNISLGYSLDKNLTANLGN
jgi:hypothetical protein